MSREKVSTFEQRVAWLRAHQELFGKPKMEILRLMKADGLIAKTTYLLDCRFRAEFHAAGFKTR